MLNRNLDSEWELVRDRHDPKPTRVLACEPLTGSNLKTVNTFDKPKLVTSQPLDAPKADWRMTFKLLARSYTVAQIATT